MSVLIRLTPFSAAWLLMRSCCLNLLCSCCSCLEVGCGSGYVICSAALAIQCLEQQQQQQRLVQASSPQPPAAAAAGCGGGCQFFATDINPTALQAAAQTLASHQVHLAGHSCRRTCSVSLRYTCATCSRADQQALPQPMQLLCAKTCKGCGVWG